MVLSWIQKLNEAYESVIHTAAVKDEIKIIPAGFTQKEIKYHVILDDEGEFVSAGELPKKTIYMIPTTPQAESRTGENGPPFPLFDQLKYLVPGDNGSARYHKFLEQLSAWADTPDAPPCLRTVRDYLEKGTLLHDLEEAKLKVNYSKAEGKQDGKGADAKAFVCFSVYSDDDCGDDLWERQDVIESWSRYAAASAEGERKLCYVTGAVLPAMESHPKVQGNAKLISAKDAAYPMQYKGRFVDDRSAASVSYAASVRAHNMLDYLSACQGFRKYGITFVAWNTNGCPVAFPASDTDSLFDTEELPEPDTFAAYSRSLRDMAAGYQRTLEQYNPERSNQIVILGMEAATKGRMSVTYYQELAGNEYVRRLENWYATCCWEQVFFRDSKMVKRVHTPTPKQITEAVVGVNDVRTAEADSKCEKSVTKLVRQMRLRLLRCIVDGAPIPKDLVSGAFHRAVSPLSFTNRRDNTWSYFDWMNCLRTTCAMIYKLQNESRPASGYEIKLNAASRERSYLYGRLLAVADELECRAMAQPQRQTNAVRLMQRFAQNPADTWAQLHTRLIPYLNRMRSAGRNGRWTADNYQNELGRIEAMFQPEDRLSTQPLSYSFLQGFDSQRFRRGTYETEITWELPAARDELFGCLLAVADVAEIQAAGGTDESHAGRTNALQLLAAFAARPCTTWARIHDKLLPYLEKMGEKGEFYQDLIADIESAFSEKDRGADEPLQPVYVHSYYRMRLAMRAGKAKPAERTEVIPAADSREAVYGQLLGLENRLERWAMADQPQEEYRCSNAIRYMTRMMQNPEETWRYLKNKKLEAYRKKKRYQNHKLYDRIAGLEHILEENHWNTNAPLSPVYLHFYYCTQWKPHRRKEGL